MTFAGSCNRDLFEIWLEECLLQQLQLGDVIVIDNASFHHSQSIEEIVAAAGCEIWYLPPDSPCCCFWSRGFRDRVSASDFWDKSFAPEHRAPKYPDGSDNLPEKTANLNKIEHWWFVLKNWMRQRWDDFDNFL